MRRTALKCVRVQVSVCDAVTSEDKTDQLSGTYVKSMSSGPGKGSRGQLMKQLRKTRQAQLAQTSRMEMKAAPRS